MGARPATARKRPLLGHAKPRIGPPRPLKTNVQPFLDVAAKVGVTPYPWQVVNAQYMQATRPGTGWLYPEVATVVGRQNGKTTDLELLIATRLLEGHAVTHAAQNRDLPRESHEVLIEWFETHFGAYEPKPRRAAGQEDLRLNNGGRYKIVAPTRSGARGPSNDLVLVDEARELTNTDFIAAAKPTTIARPWGQIAYFSNAGDANSLVLNSLRKRADNDPSLAYLEWSAPPELAQDDVRGWAAANPSLGHNPVLLGNLEREYQAHVLGDTLEVWESEYLCRWSTALGMAPFVLPEEWERQDFALNEKPRRSVLGIKVDPHGTRASAVAAWQTDKGIALDVVADVTGDPVDTSLLGRDLMAVVRSVRALDIVFDPVTDADLARYLRRSKPLIGREYASASEKFVHLALTKQLTVHDPEGILTRDLTNTVRTSGGGNSYLAVKSTPEVTNTAVEAAIRAAWVASAPRPKMLRVY